MSWNTFGRNFRVTMFGEEQGPALGVVMDGVPPGVALPLESVRLQLGRVICSGRDDKIPNDNNVLNIVSGISEGQTTGAPLCLLVTGNGEAPESSVPDVFRPGHGDLTRFMKYGVHGPSGGRGACQENLARVVAGAVAREVLARAGVALLAYALEIGGIRALACEPRFVSQNPLACPDPDQLDSMQEVLELAERDGDSVGGVVEVRATGIPAGWGDPVFDKLDARLAGALMGIAGVKGVGIGDGFKLARMRGSEANDPITPDGFESNHAGGVLGGISNGEELVARAAVKPAPGIRKPQMSVDRWGNPTVVSMGGPHEVCMVPGLVPVVESMVALVLLDAWLSQKMITPQQEAKR